MQELGRSIRRIVRFDDFELDMAGCQLSRAGLPIRLEKLPLDILIFLVERPGELVKREAIAASLWGDATFVDSEHGINTAIRKIRAALNDSPTEPRYIQTVVRRGYRFKGTIAEEDELAASSAAGSPANTKVARVPHPVVLWARVAGAAAVVALLAILLAAGRNPSGTPKLSWTPVTKALRIHSNLPLASDGKSVFWTEYDEKGCRPLRAALGGGEPLPVRMPFANAFVLDASAYGNLLVNVRENCKDMDIAGSLWELDLNAETPRRVGDLSAQAASYSPDGQRIAVGKGNELWVANRDGSAARRIVVMRDIIYIVRWSPDGTRLRFSSRILEENRYALWETNADGKQLRNLLPDWKDSSARWGGAWSSAAGGFIFEATRRGSIDLWRMTNGGPFFVKPAVEQVTAGPLDFTAPTAIPDSNDLLVVGTRKQGTLERFDSGIRRFVPYLSGISAEMADFSRDRNWIAYVTYPDGDLWRSRADGGEALQLTHAPMRAGLPRISPDGQQIAFTGDLPGKTLRLYVIPFAGGSPQLAILSKSESNEVAPTWSPDGKRLLFRYDPASGESALHGNVLKIVDLASRTVSAVRGSNGKFNQRWAPDGQWIFATPNNEDELDIYDVAHDDWSVLAKMKADYPSVSADGKFVYFLSNSPEHGPSIYRVSLATRQPEFVASLGDSERAIDEMWGQWVGLTPDGAPLILANADLQQIYRLSFERR